jgi:integrase
MDDESAASKKKKGPTLQDLVRIEKHPYFFVNPISKKITYRRTHDGKPLTIRTGKTKISEAKTFVDDELRKRATGETKGAARRARIGETNPLIEDLWFEFVETASVGRADNTKKNYGKAWKYALRGFWGKPPADPKELERDKIDCPHTVPTGIPKTIADLTPANVAAYKKWYLEKNPNRIFTQTNAILRLFIRYLVDRKHLPAFPSLKDLEDLDEIIKGNKQYIKPGRVYTPTEEKRLLVAWEEILTLGRGHGRYPNAKVMNAARARLGVLLGLKRGLRMKEILALENGKVDLKRRTLEVWSFKNKKWRTIHLDDELIEAIKYQQLANAHVKSKWLFPMPTDPERYISNQVFEKSWYKVRKIAGIQIRHKYDARFHDCRKTCATRCAELGWPVKVACEMLDMSMKIFEQVYASNVGVGAQAQWIAKTFGGGDAK